MQRCLQTNITSIGSSPDNEELPHSSSTRRKGSTLPSMLKPFQRWPVRPGTCSASQKSANKGQFRAIVTPHYEADCLLDRMPGTEVTP